MGWFDNEQEADNARPAAPQQSPRAAARAPVPAPAADAGSTLGRQIHVDGAIVCDEDLTILGRVDGTIRANGTLVVAKEADVRAKIDGERVLVHGKVNGNVHGTERVVLGQTARLTGNIEAPVLEIIEGAYFKGSVEMQPAKKQAPPQAKKEAPKPKPEDGKKAEAGGGPGGPDKPAGGGSPTGPSTGPGEDADAAPRQANL